MVKILVYFLTWTTYGTWLPGDKRGWVNRKRAHGDVVEAPSPALRQHAGKVMKEAPVVLDPQARSTAEQAIVLVANEQNWSIRALEVRSNHVHIIIEAQESSPGKVMGVLKSKATQALNGQYADQARGSWWTRGGSKRILTSEHAVEAAIRYVNQQNLRRIKDPEHNQRWR